MKIAILGSGTRGDIQPIVALGDELERRGHRVRLTVNVSSAKWAARSGLDVIAMRPDNEAFLKSPEGQRMLADGKLIAFLRELAKLDAEHSEEVTRACHEACEGADLILSTILTMYRAVTFQEVFDRPHVSLLTTPVWRTADFASYLVPLRDLRLGWLNRASWDAHYALYWNGQKRLLNEARRAVGLGGWTERPRIEKNVGIGMYSEQIVPRTSDASETMWQGGQPTLSRGLRERLGEGTLPEGLQEWLEGPPPVFFGFGSMPVLDPPALLDTVVRLCRRHSIRALVGAGWTEYRSTFAREDIFVATSFDHDLILPRCRAAVHHGGAGTTHASLRAGLPTLVCPLFADQPFWGYRVERLGVGKTFPFQQWSEARASRALEFLLRPDTAERAQRLGRSLRSENGTARIADLVERFARSQGLSLPLPDSPVARDRATGS